MRERLNNQIRAAELRVIGSEGENLGLLKLSEALKAAQEKGLDLIEISPNATPPVAKIMEYGKFAYEQNKKTPLPELIQRKISAMFSDFTQKTTETSIPATNGHANGKEQPVTSINIPAIHVNGNGMPKEALAAA